MKYYLAVLFRRVDDPILCWCGCMTWLQFLHELIFRKGRF